MDDLNTVEELSKVVSGQSILSAELHDDGLHFQLSGGPILIIAGYIAVGLYRPDKRDLN